MQQEGGKTIKIENESITQSRLQEILKNTKLEDLSIEYGYRIPFNSIQSILLNENQLPFLSSVSIKYQGFEDISEILISFIQSSNSKNLVKLDLSGSIFSTEFVDKLSSTAHLSNLQILIFDSAFKVLPQTWERLLESQFITNLQHLELSGCQVDDGVAKKLGSSPNTNQLHTLSLARCPLMTEKGLRNFFIASENKKKIKNLNISYDNYSLETARVIGSSSISSFIQVITFQESTNFDDEVASSLFASNQFQKLTELDLAITITGSNTLKMIRTYSYPSLKRLRLSDNVHFTSQDFDLLIQSPLFAQLTHFDVGATNFGDANIDSLLALDSNIVNLSNLTLYLCHEIREQKMDLLVRSKLFEKLSELNCSDTEFGDNSIQFIIDQIGTVQTHLKELLVHQCSKISLNLKLQLKEIISQFPEIYLHI